MRQICAVLVLAFAVGSLQGAVVVENSGFLGDFSSTVPVNTTVDTGTDTDRLLLVAVASEDSTPIGSAQYAGEDLAIAQSGDVSNGRAYTWLYYALAPTSGENTLAITFGDGNKYRVGYWALSGAAQVEPQTAEDSDGNPNADGDMTSITMTGLNAGDFFMYFCVDGGGGVNMAPTASASVTANDWEQIGDSYGVRAGSTVATTAGDYTSELSWTGDAWRYLHVAAVVTPEPATMVILGFGGLALLRRKR